MSTIPSFAPAKWYISDEIQRYMVLRDGKWVNSREMDPTWYDTEAQAMQALESTNIGWYTPLAHRVPWGNNAAQVAGKVGG